MEKDKKYNLVLGLMIFFFILFVGVCVALGLGFIGIKSNVDSTANNNTNIVNNDSEKSEDNSSNEILEVEENNTNKYELFSTNLKEEFSKFDSHNYSSQYISNDFVPEGYTIYLDENRNLFVRYANKEINNKYGNYKIADNVLSFYAINVGQDVGNMIYFINEDGTVGKANTEYGINGNEINFNIEKDIGYKNIVSILNGAFGDGFGGVHGPIFIDINGNIFSQNLK